MFGIGAPEFILILVVGLIVFGPSKLPELGRTIGKGLREFRKASNAITQAINAPETPPAAPVQQATQQAASVQPSATTQAAVQQAAVQQVAAGEAAVGTVAAATPTNAVAAEARPAAAETPAYQAPTQESVRQQIEAQKALKENNGKQAQP